MCSHHCTSIACDSTTQWSFGGYGVWSLGREMTLILDRNSCLVAESQFKPISLMKLTFLLRWRRRRSCLISKADVMACNWSECVLLYFPNQVVRMMKSWSG